MPGAAINSKDIVPSTEMRELTIFLVSALLAAIAIAGMHRSGFAQTSLDQPNSRSLHVEPTPRIGGMAMVISIGLTLLVFQPSSYDDVAISLAGLLALVSVIDDRSSLPVVLRLTFHLGSAVCMALIWRVVVPESLLSAGDYPFSWISTWWGFALAITVICWTTNLFNFMDGSDGLAGGMALIGFGAYAMASSAAPDNGGAMLVLTTSISGAALGFLLFNFPPAKVFMGDAGSIPCGFLAATVGIEGSLIGLWPWWLGVLVFSPFIVDATVTLLKRLFRGQKVWRAHREHYYQRLVLAGWSHRRTAFSYYVLMLACAISALAAQKGNHLFPIATFWVITYLSLLIYLEWRFYQQEKDKTEKNSEAK